MISQLIVETSEELAAYQQYEQDKNIKQKVEATQERLADLREAVAIFAIDFRQVADILESDKRQYIQDTGKGLLAQLTDSQRGFDQQRNQAASLHAIVRSINNLRGQLHGAWRLYADEQIKPRRELYNLVSSLPEVEQHSDQIDILFQDLKKAAVSFPTSPRDRTSFQTRLERLDQYLAAHHGLSDTVRQFLEQVRKEQATVADLNEEILSWCREGDRGRSFKITF